MADRDADQAVIPLIAMLVVLKLLPANLGSKTKDTATERRELASRGASQYRILSNHAARVSLTTLRCHCFHTFPLFEVTRCGCRSSGFGLSVLAASALAGKLIGGYISDRLPFDGYFRIQMSLMLIGVTGIAFAGEWLWIAVVIAGFGWGGLHALYNIVLVRLFGLTVAGRVNSTVSVAEAIGGSIGIAVTGWLADAAGYPLRLAWRRPLRRCLLLVLRHRRSQRQSLVIRGLTPRSAADNRSSQYAWTAS